MFLVVILLDAKARGDKSVWVRLSIGMTLNYFGLENFLIQEVGLVRMSSMQ